MYAKSDFVRFVLDTYDLPRAKKEKMFIRVCGLLEELSIYHEHSIYSFIDEMIYRSTFNPLRFISFDTTIRGTKNRTLHDRLGEKSQLEIIAEEGEAQDDKDEIITDKRMLELISDIRLNNGDTRVTILANLITNGYTPNTDTVLEKIQTLTPPLNEFVSTKKIRNILIENDDIKIVFGRRRYSDGPLAWYRNFFGDLSITLRDIRTKDKALYSAFLKYNQLEQAITAGIIIRTQRPYNYDRLQEFKRIFGDTKVTKKELKATDKSLYGALYRCGLLQQVAIDSEDWRTKYKDPVQAFKELPIEINSRYELKKNKGGLYEALRRKRILHLAIPTLVRRQYNKNPLALFRAKYPSCNISRSDLALLDPGLYKALGRYEQLDEAIPETKFRNFGNPLEYFNQHYKGKILTRTQLKREDESLCGALRSKTVDGIKLIDIAFPKFRQEEVPDVRAPICLTYEQILDIKPDTQKKS